MLDRCFLPCVSPSQCAGLYCGQPREQGRCHILGLWLDKGNNTQTCAHTHACTHIHTHTQTRKHTQTHTHTRTHIIHSCSYLHPLTQDTKHHVVKVVPFEGLEGEAAPFICIAFQQENHSLQFPSLGYIPNVSRNFLALLKLFPTCVLTFMNSSTLLRMLLPFFAINSHRWTQLCM